MITREQNKQSKIQRQIKQKVNYIYQHLIKLGYPKLLQLSLTKTQDIQTYISPYFQSTPSRLQLIQWLIALIQPQYRQMTWYITQKYPLNKLIKALWKIGVMPINKHTKNLDYKKYLQATIGYQNAVNLIFNLVQLAYQTVLNKKAKNDVNFGQFFHDLIDNYTQLVNENYDVYGITFPCKFINPSQTKQQQTQQVEEQYMNEFEKQYKQFYEQKMISLLQKQDELFDKIYAKKQSKKLNIELSSKKNQNSSNKKIDRQKEQQQNPQSELQNFINQLNKYKKQYNQKYNRLVDKIDNLLSLPQTKSRLIPYYLQKVQQTTSQNKYKPSVKQSIQNRSIRISPQFCKKYQDYKRIIRQIKTPKEDNQFMQTRSLILQKLYQINSNITI